MEPGGAGAGAGRRVQHPPRPVWAHARAGASSAASAALPHQPHTHPLPPLPTQPSAWHRQRQPLQCCIQSDAVQLGCLRHLPGLVLCDRVLYRALQGVEGEERGVGDAAPEQRQHVPGRRRRGEAAASAIKRAPRLPLHNNAENLFEHPAHSFRAARWPRSYLGHFIKAPELLHLPLLLLQRFSGAQRGRWRRARLAAVAAAPEAVQHGVCVQAGGEGRLLQWCVLLLPPPPPPLPPLATASRGAGQLLCRLTGLFKTHGGSARRLEQARALACHAPRRAELAERTSDYVNSS